MINKVTGTEQASNAEAVKHPVVEHPTCPPPVAFYEVVVGASRRICRPADSLCTRAVRHRLRRFLVSHACEVRAMIADLADELG